MAQPGYDVLLDKTDSRYRLSMIIGGRAAQLKTGAPTLLTPEEMPDAASNTVSVAMVELRTGKPLVWGLDLPTDEQLAAARSKARRGEAPDV
ncbi:MAG: DNA-directed RNA polymerase subunit omega [Trueperaceae bacterium]